MPDTLYLVRVGVGFDLYCSDTTGNIAYKVNQEETLSNVEFLTSQKNLTVNDPQYQYLSSSSIQVVNLPNPTSSLNQKFEIINIGTSILEIKENNVVIELFLDPKGVIKCHCDGQHWNIFVKY